MGDNMWMKRSLWIASLASTGCVTSMPVGGNETTGGETSTGPDESETSAEGDTAESESGSSSDGSREEFCDLEPGEAFEQFWSFGDYEPPIVDYDEDGIDFMCSANTFAVDDDALELTLDCSVDGADVPTQALSLSPAPQIVVDALESGEVLSMQYRAQQSCPNGCYIGPGEGWLTVRDAADELLFAQIKGRETADALTELFAPLSIETAPSGCAPVPDDLCPEGQMGFDIALDVFVWLGDDGSTLTNAGETQLGPYDVVLSRAFTGETGACEDDAGHRGGLWMRIARSE